MRNRHAMSPTRHPRPSPNITTAPPAGLTRAQAVPLAVGSVAGSGILFLPSAVYQQSGHNSLLVWALATLICLPMLVMFRDMVRISPGGDGIEVFVRAGLGDTMGRCVPVMFLAVVSIGLPAGALVAGRYVASALGAGQPVQTLVAALVLLGALAANLAGVRTSTRVQHAGAGALVAMAALLICSALPSFGSATDTLAPDLSGLSAVLPGVVLAFWAFAGFENLTFLSRAFRDPQRDFLPVSAIALGAYGLLAVLLTVAIAVTISPESLDSVTGLLQIAQHLRPHQAVVTAVTVIAVGAMVLNAVAWMWGVSRLLAGAARSSNLPRSLAKTTPDGVPRRALTVIGVLCAATTAALAARPALLVDALTAASATFVVLYLLSVVSYLRVRRLGWRRTPQLLLLALLTATLAQSGPRSLYGIAVLAATYLLQFIRRAPHRARRPGGTTPAHPERHVP
jgi:amino acid efflux transporter